MSGIKYKYYLKTKTFTSPIKHTPPKQATITDIHRSNPKRDIENKIEVVII